MVYKVIKHNDIDCINDFSSYVKTKACCSTISSMNALYQ